MTAIEYISADGRSLFPLIIWPAATRRSTWTTHPTPGWHFACSKTGYTDSAISLYWIQNVFDPSIRSRASQRLRILISDGFGTHESLEVMKFCLENNTILCRLPSHTSHHLQSCDVGIFSPLKTAYREQVENLYRGGANTVGKQHFMYLYSRTRGIAINPRNIKSGRSNAGLYPFNPERVLKILQKPQMEDPDHQETTMHTIVNVGYSPLDHVPQTPVTAEALKILRCQIEKDILLLPGPTSLRLHKLANAAERSFADSALLFDQNRLLVNQNNKKRAQQSTKSTIIGRAKMIRHIQCS